MKVWLILTLAFFPTFCLADGATPVAEILRNWKISIPLPQLNALNAHPTQGFHAGSMMVEEAEAESADGHTFAQFMHTDGVSENSLRNLIQDRRSQILNLYIPKNAEHIKLVVKTCKPSVTKLKTGSVLLLMADANRKFGACDEKVAKFRAVVAWLPCPKINSVLELSYFFSLKNSSEEMLAAISRFTCTEMPVER